MNVPTQDEMWQELAEFDAVDGNEEKARYLLLLYHCMWLEPNDKKLQAATDEAREKFKDFPFGLKTFEQLMVAMAL